ncbi:MAG: hypothetical protein WBZ19_07540 [Chthoniobacterales bacterium]
MGSIPAGDMFNAVIADNAGNAGNEARACGLFLRAIKFGVISSLGRFGSILRATSASGLFGYWSSA